MTSLNVPGIYFIRVECSSKDNLTIVVQLKAWKLACRVRSEHPEFFLFTNIVCIDSTIETAGKESVKVGELQASNCSLMFVHGGNTEHAGVIPKPNCSFTCSCSINVGSIVCNLSCLMSKSSLIKNVALWFPLPDDQLAQLFDAKNQPGAGVVYIDRTYFVFADGKALNWFQIFFNQTPNTEFSVGVGTGQETHVSFEYCSLQKSSLIQRMLFAENISAFCDLLLKFRHILNFFFYFFSLLTFQIISGSFAGLPEIFISLCSLFNPFPDH